MLPIEKLNTKIIFRSRPVSIPGNLRPLWKMCSIILMLYLSARAHKASLSKIYILNWALLSDSNQNTLLEILINQTSPDSIIVRVEPSLNRALNLVIAEGLVENVSGKNIQLTSKGIALAEKIMENESIFVNQKYFLSAIGVQKMTEQFVNRLFSEGW